MEGIGDGFGCRATDKRKDFECRIENVALNAKLEDIDFVHQTKDAALNAK